MPKQPQVSVDDLVNSTGVTCKVLGTSNRSVSSVSRIDEARSECVAFCNIKGVEGSQMVKDSNAGVIICYDDLQFTKDDFSYKTLILVSDPKLAFIRIIKANFAEVAKPGISSGTVVDEKARIHPSVCIGPNSYIGDCEIGEGTIIHGSVHIYSGTRIGENALIQAGAVIGAEGQSYARNERGAMEKFPQIGGVIIQDDVEIGSNTSIMRGAIGNTIIGMGTKVGHLCNIGHGVIIGKHCRIISMSMIGGSSRIGDYTHIKLGACVKNKLEIGNHVMVGMGAVVTRNVADGKTVIGVPAKEHNTVKR